MPRYYFHLKHDDRFIWDAEGVDLPDLRAVYGADIQAAEQQWRNVFGPMLVMSHRTTVVTNDLGEVVFVLAV